MLDPSVSLSPFCCFFHDCLFRLTQLSFPGRRPITSRLAFSSSKLLEVRSFMITLILVSPWNSIYRPENYICELSAERSKRYQQNRSHHESRKYYGCWPRCIPFCAQSPGLSHRLLNERQLHHCDGFHDTVAGTDNHCFFDQLDDSN